MRIAISGGGPGGLYFALLVKKRNPSIEVVVYEQNAADTTYGWGVVFSGRAQTFLRDADPDSYDEIAKTMIAWDELEIAHNDVRMRVDNSPFSGVSRIQLLRILQSHCERHGIDVRYRSPVRELSDVGAADLVVIADGANSTLRRALEPRFVPNISRLRNKYVWYGTPQLFATLTLRFRSNADGYFVAHAYPYGREYSTFLVECDNATWERVGFAKMTDDESRKYCANVFESDLEGKPLLSNKSNWSNFPVITTERWVSDEIVLIGDAARTVHFSIGSGTRTALEDAIALAKAFETDLPIRDRLAQYEAERRPLAKQLLGVAEQSFAWYEDFGRHMGHAPWDFAHSYMTRGGKVDEDRLRKRSPRFMESYEAARGK